VRAAAEAGEGRWTKRMGQRALIGAAGVGVGIGVGVRPAGIEAGWIVGLVGLGLFTVSMIMGLGRVIQRDWLAPAALFAVVFGMYFVLRPAVLLAGIEPVATGRQGIWVAIVLGFVVVAGFWVGYLLPVGEAMARGLPWAGRAWPKQRARMAVWVSWGLGLVGWGGMIYQSGGVVARLSGYGQGVGRGLGVVVVASAVLLGMAMTAGWLGYFKGQLSRGEIAVVTVSSASMLAVHGQRAALLVPLLMIMTVYHYAVRHLRGRDIVLIGLVGVLIVGLLGMPRLRFVGNEQVALGLGDYAKITGWLVARNLTAFDALMLVAQRVPGEVGYQWGRSYVDAIKMVVPRWLYAEKPERNLFNRLLRPGKSGSMALSLPAEGYLNFGVAGLLAETLVLGVAYRTAYSYRQRHPRSAPAILAYALAVPVFGLLWRGGLMGGGLGHLIGYGVVALGIVLFCSGPKWRVAKSK